MVPGPACFWLLSWYRRSCCNPVSPSPQSPDGTDCRDDGGCSYGFGGRRVRSRIAAWALIGCGSETLSGRQAYWPDAESAELRCLLVCWAAAILLSRNHRRGVLMVVVFDLDHRDDRAGHHRYRLCVRRDHLVGVTVNRYGLVTALCLLLLGMATVLICPEYGAGSIAIVPSGSGNVGSARFGGRRLPILLGLVGWAAFVGLGATDESALDTLGTLCTGLLWSVTMFVSQRESIQRARLRTAAEAMLRPAGASEAATRTPRGRSLTLVYREVNRATCITSG